MAIPLATTTITVLRVANDPARDGYDPVPAAAAVAVGVPAHFSAPGGAGGGTERVVGGSQAEIEWSLACDFADLRHSDRVLDENTEREWDVVWAVHRIGLGLDHTKAGVRMVEGLV